MGESKIVKTSCCDHSTVACIAVDPFKNHFLSGFRYTDYPELEAGIVTPNRISQLHRSGC